MPDVLAIPLEQIDPSPFNYRKTHSRLDELAASLREHGQQQPMKVRLVGKRYEVIFGERRLLALRKLKAPTALAMVEALTDDQVRELQIVENTQREEVEAIEEAEGWEHLLHRQDKPHTPETIAHKVGRSISYVYSRLKLTCLVPALRKALRAGHITLGQAYLIARLPVDCQADALKVIEEYREDGQELTLHDLKQHCETTYMCRLAEARFPINDPALIAGTPTCKACPKRTGNQAVLFADIPSKEVCTDPTCYRRKTEAEYERRMAEAKLAGHAILKKDASEQIFARSSSVPCGDWIDLDSQHPQDDKRRSWRKLLGQRVPPISFAQDASGAPRALVRRSDALKTLSDLKPASGAKSDPSSTAAASARQDIKALNDQKLKEANERKRSMLIRDTRNRAVAQVVAQVERSGLTKTTWQVWFSACLRGSWHDVIVEVTRRRGLERGKGDSPEQVLKAHFEKLTQLEQQALCMELCITRGSYNSYDSSLSSHFEADCKALGIDLAELKKAAKAAYEHAVEQHEKKKTARQSGAAKADKDRKEKPASEKAA